MKVNRESLEGNEGYHSGLDRIQESVISSHFMHRMSGDSTLNLYEKKEFHSKALTVDHASINDELVPILVSASEKFCEERANVARTRALDKWREYGYDDASSIGVSEFITEVILDKEFSRSGARYNERVLLNRRIKESITNHRPIEMVVPALPFKIPSPLKSRGPLPDLGEANFLLSLYEIVKTVEILYREELPLHVDVLARFTVVADGSRFYEAVNKAKGEITSYQAALSNWTRTLGLGEYIRIVDYRSLLQERLPSEVWGSKLDRLRQARAGYAEALWPVFDPSDMGATFRATVEVELDPEQDNPEGRFVSLVKSLVYTMNYRSLQDLQGLSEETRSNLYRDLTAHIFEPFIVDTPLDDSSPDVTPAVKEKLRRDMLAEVWGAAINYIAEIKSDRDLDEDPILTCLPGHLRWTIHAKQGQIAIATPPILGISVQAWAGSAVFRATSKGKIRLCSLPALLLETTGAIPVTVNSTEGGATPAQPLFYIDQGLGVSDMESLLALLGEAFTRRRFS